MTPSLAAQTPARRSMISTVPRPRPDAIRPGGDYWYDDDGESPPKTVYTKASWATYRLYHVFVPFFGPPTPIVGNCQPNPFRLSVLAWRIGTGSTSPSSSSPPPPWVLRPPSTRACWWGGHGKRARASLPCLQNWQDMLSKILQHPISIMNEYTE